jgi:hypothetical protein
VTNALFAQVSVRQGQLIFKESYQVRTVFEVLGVIGGFYTLVMSSLIFVMTYYSRVDLSSQVFKKVYKEKTQDNEKPFETKLGSLICAYALYFLTSCCCCCRKRWSCYRRSQKELERYERARSKMRTELDVVLLLKELRLLRILALKKFTKKTVQESTKDDAFTLEVSSDDSLRIDDFFDVLRARDKNN